MWLVYLEAVSALEKDIGGNPARDSTGNGVVAKLVYALGEVRNGCKRTPEYRIEVRVLSTPKVGRDLQYFGRDSAVLPST